MRVHNLDWTAFRIPFRGEFATAHTNFSSREGVIVRLTTDDGLVGLGEASPLPQDGAEGLQEVLAMLVKAKPALIGKRVDEIETRPRGAKLDRCVAAAVSCALDTAVCDVLAQAAGISMAELLAPRVSRSVVVNATVGASSTTAACTAARQARAAGFSCVKLKVGLTRDMEKECERVATVRAALGSQVQLRLDANGAWSVEQAIRMIRALAAYDLEFVEQPVSPGDVTALRQVRAAVHAPIAADEDITDLDTAQRVLQLGAAQILVLKPMATGDLLTSDLLVRPLAVDSGCLQLPAGAGLGVELDSPKLQGFRMTV